MDDDGNPEEPELQLTIGERTLEQAAKVRIPSEEAILHPPMVTVGVGVKAGPVSLSAVEMMRGRPVVNKSNGAVTSRSNFKIGRPAGKFSWPQRQGMKRTAVPQMREITTRSSLLVSLLTCNSIAL